MHATRNVVETANLRNNLSSLPPTPNPDLHLPLWIQTPCRDVLCLNNTGIYLILNKAAERYRVELNQGFGFVL